MKAKLRAAIGIAACSGFIALSYEIVWYRVLAVMTRGIASTFGLLLAAYLLGLAVGSRASARFCREPGGDPGQLRTLALSVAVANVIAALVAPAFAWSATFTDFRVGLAVVAIAAAFLGAQLPLVAHFGIEPDDRAGPRLSYLYLGNILGSAAGSLLTGFVLMDRLALERIALVLVLASFLLAAGLVTMSGAERRSSVAAYGALAAGALVAVAAMPRLYDRLYEKIIYKNEYDGSQRFAQLVENKSGVIAVTQEGTVYGGGAYDGVVNTRLENNDKNGILRAYAVGALHPAPREVLMVGLSSGSWAQVVAHLPGVEHLTIVEINPGYLEIIRRSPEVASLLSNPRVSITIDDGRRWLHRNAKRFDVIVMNTTLHWRGHATNILSMEFMELARKHLLPRGVFYFNTTDSYDVQLTAATAFPHLMRVCNFVAVNDDGFSFDRERWKQLLATMTIDDKPILDLTRRDHAEVYESLLGFNDIEYRPSIYERTRTQASVITDDNMVVEWRHPLRYPELK